MPAIAYRGDFECPLQPTYSGGFVEPQSRLQPTAPILNRHCCPQRLLNPRCSQQEQFKGCSADQNFDFKCLMTSLKAQHLEDHVQNEHLVLPTVRIIQYFWNLQTFFLKISVVAQSVDSSKIQIISRIRKTIKIVLISKFGPNVEYIHDKKKYRAQKIRAAAPLKYNRQTNIDPPPPLL